jgi:hypothetical protein
MINEEVNVKELKGIAKLLGSFFPGLIGWEKSCMHIIPDAPFLDKR